jgi:hypothetical protein
LPAKPPGSLRHNHSYMASPPRALAVSRPTWAAPIEAARSR